MHDRGICFGAIYVWFYVIFYSTCAPKLILLPNIYIGVPYVLRMLFRSLMIFTTNVYVIFIMHVLIN